MLEEDNNEGVCSFYMFLPRLTTYSLRNPWCTNVGLVTEKAVDYSVDHLLGHTLTILHVTAPRIDRGHRLLVLLISGVITLSNQVSIPTFF
jgi:hypothetical protein